MEAELETTDPRWRELTAMVDAFHRTMQSRHTANYRTATLLVALALALPALVTIAAILQAPSWVPGVLGALSFLVVAANKAWAFDDKAEFYRLIATEADNLRSDIVLKPRSMEAMRRAHERLKTLRNNGARRLPRGTGMEAAVQLRVALQNLEEGT